MDDRTDRGGPLWRLWASRPTGPTSVAAVPTSRDPAKGSVASPIPELLVEPGSRPAIATGDCGEALAELGDSTTDSEHGPSAVRTSALETRPAPVPGRDSAQGLCAALPTDTHRAVPQVDSGALSSARKGVAAVRAQATRAGDSDERRIDYGREAGTLYERFHRLEPTGTVTVRHPRVMPPVVVHLGTLVGVIYRSERGRPGEPRNYVHFMKEPPTLTSSVDGKQLFIVGGEYRVTGRGIEDDSTSLGRKWRVDER